MNISEGSMSPKKGLKVITRWFDYEEVMFLRVYYMLIVLEEVVKDDVQFWVTLTRRLATYGVFKSKEACRKHVL